MPGCILCARGLCDECHDTEMACCLEDLKTVIAVQRTGRPWKSDDEVIDPRSTMRKRAQKILKEERAIEIGSPCEWRGLAETGGGRHPIVGCRDGVVSHIHHGPDKNWFNNSPGNLHGVCHSCHNRWHARNDPCYFPSIGHSPRSATEEEMKLWNDSGKMPKAIHADCPPDERSEEGKESSTV